MTLTLYLICGMELSPKPVVEIRFSDVFKRRLKSLSKRYRNIKADIQPAIDSIQSGDFIGDQIKGTTFTVIKVRLKNSDIPTGKRGGYRLIYQVISPKIVALLLIYAKSDQVDISRDEIINAIGRK